MAAINKVTQGSLAKNKKLNEVIEAINSIANMSVKQGAEGEAPRFVFAKNKSELVTSGAATDDDGGGGGGGGGGGLPSGFAEETLDVVNSDNTAGQRVFLTKAV